MTRLIKYIVFCFVFIQASAVYAILPTSLQEKELGFLVDRLNMAIETGNYDVIVQNMPQQLLEQLSIKLHVNVRVLKNQQYEQLKKQFEMLGKDAYKLDASGVEYKETPKRTFYALVPVHIETKDAIIEDRMLFIYDKTGWHMIFGANRIVQNPAFLEVYPEFQDVTLPIGNIVDKDKAKTADQSDTQQSDTE